MAKVTNRMMEQVLCTYAQCGKWVEKLPLVSMFINAMQQLHTGKMPYKIVHGPKLCLPIDLVVHPLQLPAVEDYLSSLYKIWTNVHDWLTK